MFLNTLVRASIQDGLLIVALLIGLRFLAITPKVRVWLWRAVYVKLALSLLPLGSIPLKVLPQQPVIAQQTFDDTSEIVDNFQPTESTPTRNPLDPWLWAWGSGVVVAGVFALFRYHACREAVLQSEPTSNDEIATTLLGLAGSVGKRKLPAVFISKELSTAVVVGSRTPTILLPQDLPDSEDLRLVLAHELAHVAHRDLEWNAFTSFVDCLFFFHPLVWLARQASHQAQEAAADAAAIHLTNASPKRYGEMLVRATILDPSPSFSAGLSVGAPTGRIRKRLEELRYVNARPTIAKFVAAAMLAGIVISLAPAYQLQARESQTAMTATTNISTLGAAVATQAKPRVHRTAKRSTRKNRSSARTVRGVRAAVAPVSTVYVTEGSSIAPQAITVEGVPAQASDPIRVTGVRAASAPRAITVRGVPAQATDPIRVGGVRAASAPRAVSISTVPATATRIAEVRTSAAPARAQVGRVYTATPTAEAISVTTVPATAARVREVRPLKTTRVYTGHVAAVAPAATGSVSAVAAPVAAAGVSTIEVEPVAATREDVVVTSEPVAAAELAPATTVTIAQGASSASGRPLRVVRDGKFSGKIRVNTSPKGARTYRVIRDSNPSHVIVVHGKKGTGFGKAHGKGSGSGSGTAKGSGTATGSGSSSGN